MVILHPNGPLATILHALQYALCTTGLIVFAGTRVHYVGHDVREYVIIPVLCPAFCLN